jgi:hypothetical protein
LGFRGGGLAIVRCFNGFGAKRCDGGGGCDQAGRVETGRTDHCYASGCSDNFGCQSIRNESTRGFTIKRRNKRAIKHSYNCNINCSIKRRNKRATKYRNGCAHKFLFAI